MSKSENSSNSFMELLQEFCDMHDVHVVSDDEIHVSFRGVGRGNTKEFFTATLSARNTAEENIFALLRGVRERDTFEREYTGNPFNLPDEEE